MWLVVVGPVSQGVVAGVLKKKFQCQRLNVGIAKYHIGFTLMTVISPFRACVSCLWSCCLNRYSSDDPLTINNRGAVSAKSVANGYHFTWIYD